jgi:hypothetical protein
MYGRRKLHHFEREKKERLTTQYEYDEYCTF